MPPVFSSLIPTCASTRSNSLADSQTLPCLPAEMRHSASLSFLNTYPCYYMVWQSRLTPQPHPACLQKWGIQLFSIPSYPPCYYMVWQSQLTCKPHHACLQKWGKIAEVMGDRTPFQCAMIYNDQKDYDWFHPWLSQYGRTKRRTVGNRQQRFLSSANAITARPETADKPPKGTPPAAAGQEHSTSRMCCVRLCCHNSSPRRVVAAVACRLCCQH